jgi:membrane associated rhomboid family serine protease
MIHIRDVIPSRTTPLVTVGLIAVNALVFLFQQSLSAQQFATFVYVVGLVPAEISAATVLTSMFVHGGWLHFLGNMLYLWVFGDNVEDRLGHLRFVVFYLLCGLAAAMIQYAVNPQSHVPVVGASGAISGVLGAYLVLFPHSRVLTIVPLFFFIHFVEVPAILLLGLWFLIQVVGTVGTVGQTEWHQPGGVALFAHAGGFLAGLAGVSLFRRPERERVEWWDEGR